MMFSLSQWPLVAIAHPYYLSWQYNQCFLPMLLNVFLLVLIASFSLHCTSKWVWQITTIYLPRYTGFLWPVFAERRGEGRPGNLISSQNTHSHPSINFWALTQRREEVVRKGFYIIITLILMTCSSWNMIKISVAYLRASSMITGLSCCTFLLMAKKP